MNVSNKIKDMAVLIEFLAGAGMAIFFHVVLHSPEAAYSIFGIGILLSLATYLIREDLEKTRHELVHQYNQSHEITFAMSQINDQECQLKAQELLAGNKRTITLLQQGFIPLDETEFYLESAKCSDTVCQHLKTVDPITSGWHARGALVNYYQSNLRALERKVLITRIFVMRREDLGEPDVQKVLLSQHHDGIDVRIAFKDDLPTASDISGRDTNSSYDFAIYDDHIATEVFPQTGKYFGRKTSQAVNVEKYRHLYELVEHSAHMVTVLDDRIILASEAFKLAA